MLKLLLPYVVAERRDRSCSFLSARRLVKKPPTASIARVATTIPAIAPMSSTAEAGPSPSARPLLMAAPAASEIGRADGNTRPRAATIGASDAALTPLSFASACTITSRKPDLAACRLRPSPSHARPSADRIAQRVNAASSLVAATAPAPRPLLSPVADSAITYADMSRRKPE